MTPEANVSVPFDADLLDIKECPKCGTDGRPWDVYWVGANSTNSLRPTGPERLVVECARCSWHYDMQPRDSVE